VRRALGILLCAALAACGGSSAAPRPGTHAREAKRTPVARIDLRADPARIAAGEKVPILCYHQLRPQTAADSAVDRQYIMPPKTFKAELDTLVRDGFHTVTPDRLLAHLTTGAPLPRKPVMLTFDDTVDDQYRIALPELRRRHMTAMFFAMTVVLGNDGFMTRGQLRRLDRAGMTVAAHTWDHHRVDEYAGDDWKTQIDEPTATLEAIVGHPIRYFAYPYGAWDARAFPHLRHAGLRAAFQLIEKPIDFADPLMTIRRKIADPAWSTAEFERALRGGFRKVAAG
jgi:peptidoglycan/xylan/chitin deacetylase (PgdA/CDA1 family)